MPHCAEWLIWLAFAPVVAAIFGFIVLLFVDRDKLQSENFQIRQIELEIIEEKGAPPMLPTDTVEGEVIANPEEPALLPEGNACYLIVEHFFLSGNSISFGFH